MQHLSPLDAMFLDTEDGDSHASMAIASVAIVEGEPPSHAEITRTIAGRLPLVPRYRQKVLRVPFDLAQPVWVDDPDFDIGYHIRRTALPAPGDRNALCALIGRLMSQRLDRQRPLWEYWVVEGLENGHWAFVSKVHHCMVDGVAGNELYRLVFDDSPVPGPAIPDPWTPSPVPSWAALTAESVGEVARNQVTGLEQLARAVLHPVALQRRVAETALGLARLAGALVPAARSSVTGPIGGPRRYGVASVPLADLVSVSKAYRVTVNDVVMAVVTGAFRTLLQGRGEALDPHAIRALVPVSVRSPDARGVLGNRVAMLLPVLPIELSDPIDRLQTVHARIAALKASKEAEAGDFMTMLARYEPSALLSASIRIAARRGQRSVVTVATNVPGPAQRLYVLGQPIVEILPYVPIAGRMRFGISVMTYQGQAAFGVTGDYGTAPEVDEFSRAIVDGVAALRDAAGPAVTPAAAPPAAPKRTRAARAVPVEHAKAVRTTGVSKKPSAKQTPAAATARADGARPPARTRRQPR